MENVVSKQLAGGSASHTMSVERVFSSPLAVWTRRDVVLYIEIVLVVSSWPRRRPTKSATELFGEGRRIARLKGADNLEEVSVQDEGSMALLNREKDIDTVTPLPLPPRYRLRDLILGDYAFNDDGER